MRFLRQTTFAIAILLAGVGLTAAAWYPLAYVPARERLQKTVENIEQQGYGGPLSLYQRKDGSVLLVGQEVAPPADAVKKDSAWVRNVGLISVKQDADYPVTEIEGRGIWRASSSMRIGYIENYSTILAERQKEENAIQDKQKLDQYMKSIPRHGSMTPVHLYRTVEGNCELVGTNGRPSKGSKQIDRFDLPGLGMVTLEQSKQQTNIVGYTLNGERVYGSGFITIYLLPRRHKS